MRKIIFTVLVIIVIVFCSFAQMNDMVFGLKGGLSLGRIDSSEPFYPDAEEKFRIGFAGGALLIVPVTEKMYIQSELLYVLKGEKMEFGGEDATIIINVMEIPILFKYMINESIGFYGGFSMDYILTAEEDNPVETRDISEYINNMGFGLTFGAEYKMDRILFDGRYNLGINNIYNTDLGDFELSLNTIYLTVGYLF